MAEISKLPGLLKMLQSWLWYNDKYKMFFSKRHTNNPNEFYWFILDIKSAKRSHGHYRMIADGIFITFMRKEYRIKDIPGMRKYDIRMIQTIETTNELDYTNWIAAPVPENKGDPYQLPAIVPNNPLSY